MSYSCVDQSDRLIELLKAKGYKIAHGNGFVTGMIDEEFEGEFDADVPEGSYDASTDGVWFTLVAAPGCDVEVGETHEHGENAELCAWTDALEHFFKNARIPVDVTPKPAPVRQARWRLTRAGAWLYEMGNDTTGTCIGQAYRNSTGTWTGDPWGIDCRHFETVAEAKRWVEEQLK